MSLGDRAEQGATEATSTTKKMSRRPSRVDLSDDSDEDNTAHSAISSSPTPPLTSWKAEFNLYLDTAEFVEGGVGPLA